jgi:ABC-type polysaccharide/polyol phosphate transport system ATPase subunit
MKPILEIQNISKRYRIEHLSRTYPTFREKILQTFQRNAHETEEFWALKEVSFKVNAGESIGIIGRNGAGKSTLLKILSKITPPTCGKIISRGRIASLLEVGTGFHQELTGRENIFFNGSLLGMKRKEIEAKFDEIVDFSGVEKFLDTALKHYSSGMQLRLAFAVAAHLEPEILIIDEVLAVGDATFQRKCFQKMEDIHSHGKTILFVSHNMAQVNLLCKKGILLDSGKVLFDGDMPHAITSYLQNNVKGNKIDVGSLPRQGLKANDVKIKTLFLPNIPMGLEIHEGETIEIEVEFDVYNLIEELVFGFSLTDFYGNNVVECRSTSTINKLKINVGSYKLSVTCEAPLSSGTYNLNLGCRSEKGHIEFIPSVVTLEILPSKDGFEEWNKPSAGLIIAKSHWNFESL